MDDRLVPNPASRAFTIASARLLARSLASIPEAVLRTVCGGHALAAGPGRLDRGVVEPECVSDGLGDHAELSGSVLDRFQACGGSGHPVVPIATTAQDPRLREPVESVPHRSATVAATIVSAITSTAQTSQHIPFEWGEPAAQGQRAKTRPARLLAAQWRIVPCSRFNGGGPQAPVVVGYEWWEVGIMGTLGFVATVSLDGYVADADGDFQWSGPSDAVFAAHLDRMAEVSTEVLGRKTYELMGYWDSYPRDEDRPEAEREFARRWQDIDKVVVSSTLTPDQLTSNRARIVPRLSLDELRHVVQRATGLVEIFGPTVAAEAIRAGLVQEFRFFVVPKMVGGGLRALPDDVRLDLRLAEHTTFDETAYLRYVAR